MPTQQPGVSAPVTTSERVTNLDTARGIATLGILIMNSVSFALPEAAYFNLDAAGTETWLDWVIGVSGEIFVDQKAMALFSMLFGAGIVLFTDRVGAKGGHPVRLSLWRNLLLLGIGVLHTLLWDGDVLVVYAICAPLLIAVRGASPRVLLGVGAGLMVLSAVTASVVQLSVDSTSLGTYWFVDGGTIGDAAGLYLVSDFFVRAAAMMLVGVALYRLEILQGLRPVAEYRRMALVGLAIGLPLATTGIAWQITTDFSPDVALASSSLNTLATLPMAIGYLGLISWWNRRGATAALERVRAVGRMALTNYLTQTIIGITLFELVIDDVDVTRTGIAVFVASVWVLQLLWSSAWLGRFRYGPAEWAWRCATYRRLQPLRRHG